jgi:hypothetical protein
VTCLRDPLSFYMTLDGRSHSFGFHYLRLHCRDTAKRLLYRNTTEISRSRVPSPNSKCSTPLKKTRSLGTNFTIISVRSGGKCLEESENGSMFTVWRKAAFWRSSISAQGLWRHHAEHFFLVSWDGVRLGTSTTNWPTVPAPDDRWWVWSSWWNENWQGKPK